MCIDGKIKAQRLGSARKWLISSSELEKFNKPLIAESKPSDNQQNKLQEKQPPQGAGHEVWQYYIHGVVTVLTISIIELSLFISYGRDVYIQIQKAEGDTPDIPSSIGYFLLWLLSNAHLSHEDAKKEPGNSNGKAKHHGMVELLARRSNEFRDKPALPTICSRGDLNVLLQYLRSFSANMRDQVYLFQPYLGNHMELGIALVKLAHDLDDEIKHVERTLATVAIVRNHMTTFELNTDFTSRYRSLGQQAIKTLELIRKQQSEESGSF